MATDEEFNRRLASVISIRAGAANLTASDLVRGTGISRQSLDRSLPDGYRPLKTTELHSLARVLNVRASTLVKEAEAA